MPVFKRGALLGLGLFALSQIIEAVGYGLSGDAVAPIVVGGGTLVIIVLLGWLVVRSSAWAMIPALLLVAVGWLFFQGYNVAFEITHPESFFDFVPSVLSLSGALVVLASGIVALRGTRAGSVRFTTRPAERAAVGALVLSLAVLVCVSGALTITGRSTVSAEEKAGALSVRMRQTEFAPEQIEVSAGETPRVVVENDDPFLHTFTIDDFNIDVTVRPGSEELVKLPALASGSYTYHCAVDGHESMKGTLEVR